MQKMNLNKAVVAEHLMGRSFRQIAKDHKIGPATAAMIWRKYELNAKQDAVTPEALVDRIKRKSYTAVEAALDDPTDNYKRGGLGIKVLTGVGEFQSGDQVNVQINTIVGRLPEDWKGRYLSNDAIGEIEDAEVLGRQIETGIRGELLDSIQSDEQDGGNAGQ